jgi:DNA recombination protein RmuC
MVNAMTMVIIAAVVSLLAGLAFGVMWSRAKLAAKEAELEGRTVELAGRTESLSRAMIEIAERQKENTKAEAEISRLTERAARVNELERAAAEVGSQLALKQQEASRLSAELDGERRQSAEKLALLQSAKEDLSNQFKALASDILEEKSKKFTEQNQENLGQLLNPLRVKLTEFQSKVEEVYVEDKSGRAALAEQLKNLMGLNQQLSSDANNLTKALTGSTKMQGDWGELMLERILETSGLRKDQEYVVQQTFKNQEGRMVRPDVLIKLPENRTLIVDSKVSLIAYKEHANCDDELVRTAALKAHLDSVRKHVKELTPKAYESLPGMKAPDFVIMFVPLEPAFMLAISKDETLWEDAYRGNVLLVSPTTLLFVLRMVSQLWKTELQRQNVDEIAKRGAALYDKFVGFVEDLKKLGERLEQARSCYSDAYGKLNSGSGNLIGQVEKMRELGVKPKKMLPQELLELSDEEVDEKQDAAKA